MIVVGLTGSIGMGKSTTADMFREAGIPVHDSDAAVHRLYAGSAAPLIEAAFPGTTVDNVVDRTKLAASVLGKPQALKTLEKIVHPLVRADADAFLAEQRAFSAPLAVLDIPLLFETGGQDRVDVVVVVTAPEEVQQRRVLAREGMTEDKFLKIRARQLADAEKRKLADYVIDTSQGFDAARAEVQKFIAAVKAGHNRKRPV
ncbi:dephospho-CoA kinase [Mesorhizobium sp. NBSH29]|uniref:dephospho-CoA kinase n=1 Tax=Mesorhizobium sp. NBSH29 TaxID=2654249 RepID=UPI0018963EBE|nr:dephospho-CoA kinase [Mesorhizobium sp. NBSH29]QPC86076.1 dephospho-CoA kinase [Mesorhizobium sp. NBSH29]